MGRAIFLAVAVGRVRRGSVMRAGSLLIGLLLSGCLSSIDGGPPRLFTITEESDVARSRLMTAEDNYYAAAGAKNKTLRNEIIAARMRAVDSYYYAFEASLIRERQELGFISSIISIGLSGAVPLVYAEGTKNILGAASSGLQGASKAFSDEVLFQKTVQVLATQMRARRDAVASDIITRTKTLDVDEYPLSMALGDVDEYYAAGTIAGALIEIQKTVGAESDQKAEQKARAVISVTFGSDPTTQDPIDQYILAEGANGRKQLNAILRKLDPTRHIFELRNDGRPEARALRARLIEIARSTLPNFPR
jgi:hypothetical protein